MTEEFKLSSYSYQLPPSLIAQEPVCPRDTSRLLVVTRKDKSIKEGVFADIVNFINPGDTLVLNDTKVINAKLIGSKPSGAKIEILLVKQHKDTIWEVLLKPAKRIKTGSSLIFANGEIQAKVLENTLEGLWLLEFSAAADILLRKAGKVPLPHYIKKDIADSSQYQTVYAQKEGAIAAPTAGLHFTEELLNQLKNRGTAMVKVTLHCGLATFRPVKTADIRQHKMESEWIEVSEVVEKAVNSAKAEGSKVIAVGTTSMRALESAGFSEKDGRNYIKSFSGRTNLYITPGYNFKIIDAVLTNFHTPYSTNLILVSTFCGWELTRRAYAYAIKEKFRFYSFGDAMLII